MPAPASRSRQTVIAAYLASARQALDAAERERIGTTVPVWLTYALSLLFTLLWAVVGPGPKPHHFFSEGGPVDWLSSVYLLTATLFACSAGLVQGLSSTTGRWFWPASTIGLGLLLIDERFQLHEGALSSWPTAAFGSAPIGNWNDIVVLAYGVVALALLLAALPVVLRQRRFRALLVAAFVFYGLHTFLDAADEVVPWLLVEEMAEESFKLLSSASLMLAYMYASQARSAEAWRRRIDGSWIGEQPAWRGSWALTVYLVTLLLFVLFRPTATDWYTALGHRWGESVVWLASAYLGASVLLTGFASRSHVSGSTRGARWLVPPALLALAVLALDEATLATRYVLLHRLSLTVLPWWMTDARTLLHAPGWMAALPAWALLFTVAVGRPAAWPGTAARRLSGVGLTLLALMVGLALLIPASGNTVLRLLLLVAGSSLLLAGWSTYMHGLFEGRSRAVH